MHLAALIAICASMAAEPGAYTGAAKCGQCHPAESRSQSGTGHARALYPAARHPLAASFLPRGALKRRPNFGFAFSADPFRVRVFDETNVLDIPIDWAFGAGLQAVTFVSRIDRGWYLEHHFSYYPALHGLGVTPGQQGAEAKTLPEAAGLMYQALDPAAGALGCFECHSTGPVDTAGEKIQPSETGVHCEACHGPGARHARTGDPKQIQNPKRMTAAQLNIFCGNCHRPPASKAARIDWNFAWNVRHQPVYLSQSACFRRSAGALSCLTCHTPHESLRHDDAFYNGVCAGCHRTAHPAVVAMRNCVDCHMPRVSPQSPLRFTNHWIGIYADGAKLKPVARR